MVRPTPAFLARRAELIGVRLCEATMMCKGCHSGVAVVVTAAVQVDISGVPSEFGRLSSFTFASASTLISKWVA